MSRQSMVAVVVIVVNKMKMNKPPVPFTPMHTPIEQLQIIMVVMQMTIKRKTAILPVQVTQPVCTKNIIKVIVHQVKRATSLSPPHNEKSGTAVVMPPCHRPYSHSPMIGQRTPLHITTTTITTFVVLTSRM